MSFAHDVKNELCREVPANLCCRRAELYGALLFARSFSPTLIVLQTENEAVLHQIQGLLLELYGIEPHVRSAPRSDGNTVFILSLEKTTDLTHVLGDYGYGPSNVSMRLNRAVLENECCPAAFLRGAFLSCGSVVEPEKDYHLEFASPHWGTAKDLTALLYEQGFSPKNTERNGSHIVYFKESGQIEDLLTLIGAARLSLELMNVKVYKDLRNKANRVTNCETANIGRTVDAATRQVEEIRRILDTGGVGSLPEELRTIALLRFESPELSLRELSVQLGISRSGVNHRLRRLSQIAAEREGRAQGRPS